MKNKIESLQLLSSANHYRQLFGESNSAFCEIEHSPTKMRLIKSNLKNLPEILFITSYPPRECGIATYSQDLIKSLNNQFNNTMSIKVCALESGEESLTYPSLVKYTLKTSNAADYINLAFKINRDQHISLVVIQHEFGFYNHMESQFQEFLYQLNKPIIIVFHTVLPNPDIRLKFRLQNIADVCQSIIVMTNNAARILTDTYQIPEEKIIVIPHGTHLVPHIDKNFLKKKYGLEGRQILTTFGLLSSGKSIETTLEALPAVIKTNQKVLFLIIGKTHPEVLKNEGEKYRSFLESIVEKNNLGGHVKFINSYLALPDLLEYLQLTDIYLFTTNDPHQAVSGTFAYALSCGCPIISTPIPHAKEILTEDTGIIFDFLNSTQLGDAIIGLLADEEKRKSISTNALQKIVASAWENSAVAHGVLFKKIADEIIKIEFKVPKINLDHLKKMTTDIGIIQFAKINQPDLSTGYTLDDNARALVSMCMYYELSGEEEILNYIRKYLSFIKYCLQPSGDFLNYVDRDKNCTDQNKTSNLDDSNGRAIWALGYLAALKGLLPIEITSEACKLLERSLPHMITVHSPRAIAFAIKGLYYYSDVVISPVNVTLFKLLANRLAQMYRHESVEDWEWFEGYLTYANSIMPEALLCAWQMTGNSEYKDIALASFGFLLSQTFNENGIEVISNKEWLQKGQLPGHFGEQPIDVAYTIMTLSKFYDVFNDEQYKLKMVTAFNWFLGNNRLNQIVYNPCTGGCYDGMEEHNINLNQGAESTVSYLLARLTIENYRNFNSQG